LTSEHTIGTFPTMTSQPQTITMWTNFTLATL